MRSKRMIAALMLVVFLAGCSTPAPGPKVYQVSPDFGNQASELKKLGVVIDAHVYTLCFPELCIFRRREDGPLSTQATKNFEVALVQELTAEGVPAVVLPLDDDAQTLVKQYKDARGQVDWPFRGKPVAGLEPLTGAASLASKAGVDGIVIVSGNKLEITGVYKGVFEVSYVVSVADVFALMARSGSMSSGDWNHEPHYNADFAMFDKTGKILFYDRNYIDITNADDVSKSSAAFLDNLNGARR